MSEIGTTTILSTAYHQQTDGQTERNIQELQVYFRIYMDYQQTNWLHICPIAQYAINDAKSTATGETPNFTVFGNERGTEEMEEFSHQQKMTTIHNKVQNELEWTKAIQKKYYDREREEAPSLKEGDSVYLKRRSTGKTTFNLKTKRTSTKLDYLKLGSFVIKRKLDYDNYELNLPTRMKIHPVFHISLLTKTDIPETAENEPINDEEYEVERVIKKRVRPGKVEKWLGYENCDNTWEPVTNLYCPKLIQKFERRQQRKAKKKANCQRKAKKKADYEQDELSQC